MKRRSKFNLSYPHNLTTDMGVLTPIGLTPVLPGDTFRHSTTALVRMMPLMAPVMHPIHVTIHHWFVPFRLLWDNWENFITGGSDGLSVPTFPTIRAPAVGGFPVGGLMDHLGQSTGVANFETSALPARAMALLYNQCYRDEDLNTPIGFSTADGLDTTTSQDLQNVCWEKDYYTTSRPWEQKGAEVTLPLVGQAKLKNTAAINSPLGVQNGNNANNQVYVASSPSDKFYVDGADFDAPDINESRFAYAWQRVLESRARWGSRYTELLRAWGVKSSDARLQRPEYLGGGNQTIQFSEVLGSANNDDTVLGQLGGHGIGAIKSNTYKSFFEEHGFVVSVAFLRPITLYAQGSPRHWNYRVREDFWQPEMQHIGQQAIKNKEIYAAHPQPDATFGFQDRFDENRRNYGVISGLFKTTLDFWSAARIFGSAPALNGDFVKCVPTKDIFAVPSEPGVIIMAKHNIYARRLVAKVGTSFIR